MFVDAFCIPKGAANKELAEIYINFMLSEEIAIANAEYIYYASPNSAVYESEVYKEDMGEEAMEVLYPEGFSFAENYNALSFRNLDADTLALVNDLWEELKIDGGIGAAVYILAAVIVVLIAGFFVYRSVVKKKREKLY